MGPKSAAKLVIDWDVRGWMSNQQSIAVLALEGARIEWLGSAARFRLAPQKPLTLLSLLSPALDDSVASQSIDEANILLAIDAPLAYPVLFRQVLNGAETMSLPPRSEIESRLAYRDCERWVHKQFGKKPLSAPFDKLGNNASLALSVCSALKRAGFRLIPQDDVLAGRAIIEVYPGLVKAGPRRGEPAIAPLARHIPPDVEPGTDLYDAMICALLGAVHLDWGSKEGIPKLIAPSGDFDRSEGWIFCLPPEYVRSFQLGQSVG